MRKKRLLYKVIPLLLCLLLLLASPIASAASQNSLPSTRVLLMYDSLAIGTVKEGNIEALQRVLASLGVQVTRMSYDKYEAGTLSTFQKVIAVRNADDLGELPESFNKDMNAYDGDYMHIGAGLPSNVLQALNVQLKQEDQDTVRLSIGQLSQSSINVNGISYITKFMGTTYGNIYSEKEKTSYPFSVMNGKYAYIPYMVKGDLSEQAPSYVLKDWLSLKSTSHFYVMINDIYPFSDLNLLKELADRLYNAGIPFLASVQPVLSNLDYPSTQRYLETLKQVQSHNGSIIINAPVVVSNTSQEATLMNSQMSTFLDLLASEGIAPLGTSSEMYWIYDKHYTANGMSFFDSSIVWPNQRILYHAESDTSSVFASSMYTMKATDFNKYTTATRMLDPLPMDTAIVYPFPEKREELDATVDALISNWTTFTDYANESHTVRTKTNEMTSVNGLLQINGENIALNNNIENIDSEHTYVQEDKISLTTLFSIQNNILIGLILSTLLIFAAFLIIGYRLYRRKFTHQG